MEIQSNRLMTTGSCVAFANKYKVTTKETTIESVPTIPTMLLPAFLPRKTLNKNPKKGANSKTKTKLVSIEDYPFKFFKFPTSIVPIFLKIETKIANPTATSAAATAIEKKTKTCPCAS
jgi:hypothetical protein